MIDTYETAERYHASPGASASRLKKFKRSAAHMKYDMDNPEPSTPAMVIGSATHSAILEPSLFEEHWGRLPYGDGRTKAMKDAKADLVMQYGDEYVLKAEPYDRVLAMRDSVLDNTQASTLLDGAQTEISVRWEDITSGVACKARIDAVSEDYIVDIKTTEDASPEGFARSCHNFNYHLQAAHYLAGAKSEELVGDGARFVFVAVEKAAPHCVALYELDAEALDLGRRQLDKLLGEWARCEASGEWAAYPEEVQELSLPVWAYNS